MTRAECEFCGTPLSHLRQTTTGRPASVCVPCFAEWRGTLGGGKEYAQAAYARGVTRDDICRAEAITEAGLGRVIGGGWE